MLHGARRSGCLLVSGLLPDEAGETKCMGSSVRLLLASRAYSASARMNRTASAAHDVESSTRVSDDSLPCLPRISQIRRSPFACSSRPKEGERGKGKRKGAYTKWYLRFDSAINSDARALYKEFGLPFVCACSGWLPTTRGRQSQTCNKFLQNAPPRPALNAHSLTRSSTVMARAPR